MNAKCPWCHAELIKTEWKWLGDCPNRHGMTFYEDAYYETKTIQTKLF